MNESTFDSTTGGKPDIDIEIRSEFEKTAEILKGSDLGFELSDERETARFLLNNALSTFRRFDGLRQQGKESVPIEGETIYLGGGKIRSPGPAEGSGFVMSVGHKKDGKYGESFNIMAESGEVLIRWTKPSDSSDRKMYFESALRLNRRDYTQPPRLSRAWMSMEKGEKVELSTEDAFVYSVTALRRLESTLDKVAEA